MNVPKRFVILRFVAGFFKVLAWIVLVGALLGAIGAGIAGASLGPFLSQTGMPPGTMPVGIGGGILIGMVLLLLGVIDFLVLYAVGEGIQLQLAVEENTRLTAALLMKLDEENRRSTATHTSPGAYYGEVVDQ